MAQISCNKVSMSYEKKLVLEDISFDVYQGDYLCIIGENGSGKTTLMKGILGLMPLKSGSIAFGDGVKQNSIGYLSQQTIVQRDFPASVFEVVLSGCLNKRGLKPFYSSKEKKNAFDSIALLGIGGLENKSYRALSGGQQQRVLLARALCSTEKILLLDEPVAGLDPIVTSDLYNIIHKLNKENGVTIVMISHDINSALHNASKILHLSTHLEFFGQTSDYTVSQAGSRFIRNNEKRSSHETGGVPNA